MIKSLLYTTFITITLLYSCKQAKKTGEFPIAEINSQTNKIIDIPISETSNQPNKVVDFPLVGMANTTNIVIERVELTDSVTLITMRGYGLSGRWIKVTPKTRLMTKEKEYKLTGSQGITIGEPLVIPEDGDTCFTLFCEPLPIECKEFDYIGGEFERITILDESDTWKLYDINLTGKTGEEYPAELPSELQKVPYTDNLPIPKYAYTLGETTINVHLMGYRQGCCEKFKLTTINTFEEQRNFKIALDTLTGKGTVQFVQYGTCQIFPNPDFSHISYGYFFIAPGETVNLYVNLACVNNHNKNSHFPPIKGCWTKGSMYDALNNLPHHTSSLHDSLAVRVRFGMTADELTDTLLNHYHKMTDYIDSQAWHPWLKAMKKAEVFNESLFQLVLDDRYYSEGGGDFPVDYMHDNILPHHFDKLFAQADLENHWLLLAPSEIPLVEVATLTTPDKRNKTLTKWTTTLDAVKQAYNGELPDSILDLMHSWENSFYAEMCKDIVKRTKETIGKNKKIGY